MSEQRFGIRSKKENDFHDWYTQVILRSELLDYYDIRGCFIMRPASMFMWSHIRSVFDERIRSMGVQECYFPMLVSRKNLELEKGHLENFNPELAWITKCGDKDIDDPVAIRPTSETIMYPAFARWLSSYRELPLKLNQWCSVLRWEVRSTLPFIRGREFLWQEGHTAHYRKDEAEEETMEILELYASIYEDVLAVPVVRGRKSRKETFGGAEYTLSVEAFIPGTGKGVQGATSHHLGQNFSRMFGIMVDNEEGGEDKSFVYQNCWGLTTRSLGIATMIHSDNRGFVCPPRIAQIQAVVVLCGITSTTTSDEERKLGEYAQEVIGKVGKSSIRVHFDDRRKLSPGFKFNHWELRGVPLRIEIGFRDMRNGEVCVVRRDTREKSQVKFCEIAKGLGDAIDAMHRDLFNKALAERTSRTKVADNFKDMLDSLNDKNIVLAPWCSATECEDEIGEKTTAKEGGEVVLMGAKSLCIPFDAPSFEGKKCISCSCDAKCFALFGRSY